MVSKSWGIGSEFGFWKFRQNARYSDTVNDDSVARQESANRARRSKEKRIVRGGRIHRRVQETHDSSSGWQR